MIKTFLYQLDKINNKILKNEIDDFCKLVYRKDYSSIKETYKDLYSKVDKIKVRAIKNKDENLANATFLIKIYLNFIISYNEFLNKVKEDKHKESWNYLQDCIDCLKLISKYEESKTINALLDYFEKIEQFYPFKLFCSIEAKFSKITCSICHKDILDPLCTHRKGKLYWGEMCSEIVNKVERVDAVAIVKNPYDKRCILELQGVNQDEQFIILKSIKKVIQTPFLNFSTEIVKSPIIKKRKIIETGKINIIPSEQISIFIGDIIK
ncbi:MAG: hypothetical protein ACI4TT_02715 [Christensenellales bacterium]